MSRRFTRALALCGALLGIAAPRPAAAWDPAVTHLGMVDAALRRSAVHLRWMAGSELTRGLFTPLTVDPERLTPGERRFLNRALLNASDATGSRPLGGPGTCPGEEAPTVSRRYCVDGERWQMGASSWIELGVLAELSPSAREVHHFVDPKDPTALTWSDPELPRWLLRLRLSRHNGAPLAGNINRTNFDGHGRTALAWLADDGDVLAPPRLYAHLERAYLEADPAARQHHLAMALVCLGALLHVAQDLSVPAHARADVSAFFAPLSGTAGDRGLPLQEVAKGRYGRRDLPLGTDAQAIGEARGKPLAGSLAGHLIGEEGDAEAGIARFTAARFFSESTVPAAAFIDAELDAEAAAAALLKDAQLDPVEKAGARLSPWPAERGYLLSAAGRPLAAFDTDDAGRVRPYIDSAVYNDQMRALLPRAVDTTRSLLDFVFPGWPAIDVDRGGERITFEVDKGILQPELLVVHQSAAGVRATKRKVSLRPGERNRIDKLPETAEGERVILVLRGKYASGDPLLWELTLPTVDDPKTIAAVPAPYEAPEASGPESAEGVEDDEDDDPLLPLEGLDFGDEHDEAAAEGDADESDADESDADESDAPADPAAAK
ncbi:MAG: hypothetical protein KC486_35295 [Myxococcales bacterium]|nr:hypothetical protein [Myxococcales bacterium]